MTDKYTVSRKVAFLRHQLKQDDLRFSSMVDYESSSRSSGEEELQLLSAQHKVQTSQKISKQLQYYYRRTEDKQKRKYTPFTDQENPSRQLKRYHATKANSSDISMDPDASETTSEWETETCKPFYLGAKKASISRQLLSIKPPDIVGRLPRSLEDLKHWKATELKNWLLHYSVAVLRNKLNALYAFHWSLLVGAIGILCSDSIYHEDLRHADSMLQDFVLLMGILYVMYNEHPPFATPCLLRVTKRTSVGL